MRLPDLLAPAPEPCPIESGLALRRRRLAVGGALVTGAALLSVTLRVETGSGWFVALGLLVAATWVIGSLVSGPIRILPVEPIPLRTLTWQAAAVGVIAFLGFLSAYLVAEQLPVLSAALDSVLGKADASPLAIVLVVALVNGVAEELFFRGALHAALEPHRAAVCATLVYVAVTAATGNLALVVAAAVMGTIFTLERMSMQSVLAPMITHVTWSVLILLALPR